MLKVLESTIEMLKREVKWPLGGVEQKHMAKSIYFREVQFVIVMWDRAKSGTGSVPLDNALLKSLTGLHYHEISRNILDDCLVFLDFIRLHYNSV